MTEFNATIGLKLQYYWSIATYIVIIGKMIIMNDDWCYTAACRSGENSKILW